MIKHYISIYGKDNKVWVEAWLQFNIFGKCFCFSKRKEEITESDMDLISAQKDIH